VNFGEYERTVDYKGRLTVPAHLLLAGDDVDWSQVMVLKGDTPSLFVYDVKTWRAILNQAYTSMDDDESRLFMHRALADAYLSDIDNLKRITIPAPLLEYAEISKRVTVVGMFNRLELWSPDIWQEYLGTLEDVSVPSLADLSRAQIRQVS
jgi:MraZ protein